MDQQKKKLVKSIMHFLLDEIENSNLIVDHKESVEVAVQCLETAYDLEGQRDSVGVVNLLELIDAPKGPKQVPDADKVEADGYKNRGNDFMKTEQYQEAIREYTRAIKLDPYNAVYYCNRAAAFNRLNQFEEAIADCEGAIKLDATYGKAYGRLGIAYSNLNRFADAKDAYAKAAQLDPSNPTYLANMRLAEKKIGEVPNLTQYMSNPNIINIASQMLNDPSFRNMMSRIMTTPQGSDNNLNVLLQAGAQLAAQMETSNPEFVETLRQTLDSAAQQPPSGGTPEQGDGNPEP